MAPDLSAKTTLTYNESNTRRGLLTGCQLLPVEQQAAQPPVAARAAEMPM